MTDYRRRNEYIEGEYEVLEERDWYEEPAQRPPPKSGFGVDTRPPFVTYVFLGLNIAAFLLMSIVGFLFRLNLSQQLWLFGAKVNELIAYGQRWRLLTAVFLHVGLAHLFFNSYALFIYGPIVESLFGKVKFALVYLVSGLTGSLLSYLLSPNPAAGASGAIFGLMGSLLYFRQRRREIFRRIFGPRLFIIIAFNLLYGLSSSGIDNWGHIGGLIGGCLVGYAVGLYRERVMEPGKLLVWVLIILMFVLGMQYGEKKYTIEFRPYLPGRRDSIQEYRHYHHIHNQFEHLERQGFWVWKEYQL